LSRRQPAQLGTLRPRLTIPRGRIRSATGGVARTSGAIETFASWTIRMIHPPRVTYPLNVVTMLVVALLPSVTHAQETGAPQDGSPASQTEGLLPVPDYSGDWRTGSKLTGDWSGLRQ